MSGANTQVRCVSHPQAVIEHTAAAAAAAADMRGTARPHALVRFGDATGRLSTDFVVV